MTANRSTLLDPTSTARRGDLAGGIDKENMALPSAKGENKMARFNQFARAPRNHQTESRRKSLEALGFSVGAVMERFGLGARRACTKIEKEHGIHWKSQHDRFGAGHFYNETNMPVKPSPLCTELNGRQWMRGLVDAQSK